MGIPHTAEQSEETLPTRVVSKDPQLCKCGLTKNEKGYCDGSHKALENKNKDNE